MSDIVKVIYNGVDAFAPQPTPYIALDVQSIYAGEYLGKAETLVINGQLTGCTFDAIVDAQNTLINRFNKSFQSLEIWQVTGAASGKAFQKDLVEIDSISFSNERWFGILPYTINLSCYPSGYYSGAFGILNPQDTWSFDEQRNEVLDINHVISCQPFNTSSGPSNALENARNWAFGRTGIGSWVYPIMISGVSPDNFCLLSQVESIDRFNGTYSITETYSNDLARSGYGVIRYNTTVESGNDLITVSLNGTVEGCQRNITGTRAAFANIDKTAIATKAYQYAFGRTDLNPIPLAQSFDEDPFTSTIRFSYSYDNSNLPEVWFDYTVDLAVGTNGRITASIQGVIRARGGDVASKLARTQVYANTVNLYDLVLPFYNSFDASSITPLNPVPIANGKTINQSNGTVELNATFDNQQQVSSIFDRFEYTINIVPSRYQIDSKPTLNGLGTYSTVNLNYASRATLSVNGTAVVSRNVSADAGVALVKQKALQLFFQYGNSANAALDVDNVTVSRTDDRVISFNIQWSCGPVNPVGPTTISTISL